MEGLPLALTKGEQSRYCTLSIKMRPKKAAGSQEVTGGSSKVILQLSRSETQWVAETTAAMQGKLTHLFLGSLSEVAGTVGSACQLASPVSFDR